MLNLTPHNRFHVPNKLAMLAAVLLLISSVIGFEPDSELKSSEVDSLASVTAVEPDSDDMKDRVVNKRRTLNLGFLLFRR